MSSEESIYNLIPSPERQRPKESLYKSKYPGDVQTERQHAATFGVPITSGDISPKRYLKKGTSGSPYASPKTSPEKTVTKRDHTITKPPVPSKDEKPVYGLVSQKNYITANAVDNILSVPPRRVSQDVDYLRKTDYGQVPAYLENVKRQIQAEYDLIRQIEEQTEREDHDDVELLTDEERDTLLQGLKHTWEMVNKEYQTLSFTLDTESKKKRKERCEAQLEQIEKDIGFLSKKFVFLTPSEGAPLPHKGGSGAVSPGVSRSPAKSVGSGGGRPSPTMSMSMSKV